MAADGKKKAVHAMATTDGSAVPIAGQTQHKVLSDRRWAQRQQLTFFAVAFKSGLTPSRTLCFAQLLLPEHLSYPNIGLWHHLGDDLLDYTENLPKKLS